MIGDSVSDVAAAEAAGIACIGYANKAGKREALSSVGAYAVIDHLGALREAQTLAR